MGRLIHRHGRSPVSLRLGHISALTIHRKVIHYRNDATLPHRGRLRDTHHRKAVPLPLKREAEWGASSTVTDGPPSLAWVDEDRVYANSIPFGNMEKAFPTRKETVSLRIS